MAPDASLAGRPLVARALSDLGQALAAPAALADDIDLKIDGLAPALDSSAMGPGDWQDIARKIADNYDAFDGFVIVHGTDTLAYTAAALSFMFENLAKPVVLTGSQVPLAMTPNDAVANYRAALLVAAAARRDGPVHAEVLVVFGGRVLRGCRVRKTSAVSWQAFDAPNGGRLGEVADDVHLLAGPRVAPLPDGAPFRLLEDLDTNVIDITLYPGLRPDHLHAMLTLDGVRGVVLRTFGAGNAPDAPEFLDALRAGLAANDAVAVNVTQCLEGSVAMGRYGASAGLAACGVIGGGDMTPEAALVKLMHILARSEGEAARNLLQQDLRGELSPQS